MEPAFLEPSTGRRYSPSACPYEGIEWIFNAANFWVCLQVGAHFPSQHCQSTLRR
jgi:hypothetical protein